MSDLDSPQFEEVEKALGFEFSPVVRSFFTSDPRRSWREFTVFDDDSNVRYFISEFQPVTKETLRAWSVSPPFFPFASDGCGNPYCVEIATGRVVFLDEGEEEPQLVAPSFESFLSWRMRKGDYT